jgi:hypothetical protein
MRDLGVVFLSPRSQQYGMMPGEIYLITTDNRCPGTGLCPGSMINTYIVLPDTLLYQPQTLPSTPCEDGWFMLLRSALRSWYALTYKHRILRACDEAIFVLRQAMADAMFRSGQTRPNDVTMAEVDAYDDAAAHYEDIRDRITAVTDGHIREDMIAAVRNVAIIHGRNPTQTLIDLAATVMDNQEIPRGQAPVKPAIDIRKPRGIRLRRKAE